MPLFDFNQLVETAKEAKPAFKILEPGDYDFVIDELPENNTEKYYWKVTPKVVDGPREGFRHYALYVSYKPDIAPGGARNTLEFLTATGLTPDQIAQASNPDDIANYLLGKRFTAKVEVEPNTYQGVTKDQNRLRGFRPSTGAPVSGPTAPSGPTLTPTAPSVPQAQTAPNPFASAPQPTAPAPVQQQANPWDVPVENNGPTTSFQAPPMPFGNG